MKNIISDISSRFSVADIDVETLISKYRDVERIEGYCRSCGNYGKKWMCPPFTHGEAYILEKYRMAHILVTKLMTADYPAGENDRADLKAEFIVKEARAYIDDELRELERSYPGSLLLLPGSCLLCGDEACAKERGEPCRHKDEARPSLESLGFDVSLLIRDLFNMELKWCIGNELPEYFVLVAAILT